MDSEKMIKAFDDLLEAVDCPKTFSEMLEILPEESKQQLLPEISKIYNKYMTAAMAEINTAITKVLK